MMQHSRRAGGLMPSMVRSLLEFFRPEPTRTLPPLIRPTPQPLETLRHQSEKAVRSAPILEALQDMFHEREVMAASNGRVPLVTREIELMRQRTRGNVEEVRRPRG